MRKRIVPSDKPFHVLFGILVGGLPLIVAGSAWACDQYVILMLTFLIVSVPIATISNGIIDFSRPLTGIPIEEVPVHLLMYFLTSLFVPAIAFAVVRRLGWRSFAVGLLIGGLIYAACGTVYSRFTLPR